jgi:hypothetical protein
MKKYIPALSLALLLSASAFAAAAKPQTIGPISHNTIGPISVNTIGPISILTIGPISIGLSLLSSAVL